MKIKYLTIVSLLVIAVVSISGCTTSSGSTGTSDRDVILQGIASGEQSCIDNLPSGASTDKCQVTSTNKEIIVSQVIADARASEQKCLQNIQRSTNSDVCTISSATKQAAAARSAICIDNVGNNNVNAVRSCVDTAFAAVNS